MYRYINLCLERLNLNINRKNMHSLWLPEDSVLKESSPRQRWVNNKYCSVRSLFCFLRKICLYGNVRFYKSWLTTVQDSAEPSKPANLFAKSQKIQKHFCLSPEEIEIWKILGHYHYNNTHTGYLLPLLNTQCN